jgi:hypothetical protein
MVLHDEGMGLILLETVMVSCRKHKLADQNLPAMDSARSRNIRRNRNGIAMIQMGSNTWNERITE